MKPKQFFQRAVAVWPSRLAKAINVRLSLHARVVRSRNETLTIRFAASSGYRIWCNGKFLGQGPARAAHGYARVDTWKVPETMTGTISLVLEIVSYGIPTFCEASGKAFCCAEIALNGKSVIWTASKGGGFVAESRPESVRHIERYSYQRAFCEGYRFGAVGQNWLQPDYHPTNSLTLKCVVPQRVWLNREFAYPCFDISYPKVTALSGRYSCSSRKAAATRQHRFLHQVPEISQGYPLSQIDWPLFETLAGMEFTKIGSKRLGARSISLNKTHWIRTDFGAVKTGFPCFSVKADRRSRILVLFDEILLKGHIQFDRLECLNAFWLELEAGASLDFQTFEPYTLRFLQIVAVEGSVEISNIRLRNYVTSAKLRPAKPGLSSKALGIRNAALSSFRQNVLDIFMDCPSRERAGWLCDSLFIGRAEWHLCGDNPVERAFLENYLRPKNFRGLPSGMVPMCYPAEALEGVFIPNWAMFLVLQLDEAKRARALPSSWQPMIAHRVQGLLRYFKRFENEFGLLEKLQSWVFVEWSGANSLVQDVNFPTNMLYAAMLESAGHLLREPAYVLKARELRNVIRKMAWSAGRFVDNALRTPSGNLVPTTQASEVCQYYAFSFNLVSPDEKPELWNRLVREDYQDLLPANAFIGKLLRLELLLNHGKIDAARGELMRSFAPMARRTGTLWEHLDERASCNHGFTSYVAVLIDRLADMTLKLSNAAR